jgi:hypothetical protein
MSVGSVLFRELSRYVQRFYRESIPLTGIVQTPIRAETLVAVTVSEKIKQTFRASPAHALDCKACSQVLDRRDSTV